MFHFLVLLIHLIIYNFLLNLYFNFYNLYIIFNLAKMRLYQKFKYYLKDKFYFNSYICLFYSKWDQLVGLKSLQ